MHSRFRHRGAEKESICPAREESCFFQEGSGSDAESPLLRKGESLERWMRTAQMVRSMEAISPMTMPAAATETDSSRPLCRAAREIR